jgi:hypothetical protein
MSEIKIKLFLWGKYPPRSGLLGLWPAVSFATPSWVQPGTCSRKLHASAGRTLGEQLRGKIFIQAFFLGLFPPTFNCQPTTVNLQLFPLYPFN